MSSDVSGGRIHSVTSRGAGLARLRGGWLHPPRPDAIVPQHRRARRVHFRPEHRRRLPPGEAAAGERGEHELALGTRQQVARQREPLAQLRLFARQQRRCLGPGGGGGGGGNLGGGGGAPLRRVVLCGGRAPRRARRARDLAVAGPLALGALAEPGGQPRRRRPRRAARLRLRGAGSETVPRRFRDGSPPSPRTSGRASRSEVMPLAAAACRWRRSSAIPCCFSTDWTSSSCCAALWKRASGRSRARAATSATGAIRSISICSCTSSSRSRATTSSCLHCRPSSVALYVWSFCIFSRLLAAADASQSRPWGVREKLPQSSLASRSTPRRPRPPRARRARTRSPRRAPPPRPPTRRQTLAGEASSPGTCSHHDSLN